MTCLKKILLLAILLFTFAQFTIAVESTSHRIVLKTGEIYTGEIVLKNDDIVLIRTLNGERFQFPASQVKNITKITDKPEEISTNEPEKNEILPYQNNNNFCSVIEISGGLSQGENSFKSSTSGDITLSFGTRSISGKSLFVGGGAGFSIINIISTKEISNFIPVFLRFQSNNLIQTRTSPFFSLDAGYAFALKTTMSGGIYTKLSGGFIHRLNIKTSLQLGFYVRVQQYNSILSENLNGSIYIYPGSSVISSFGALAGFQF